MSHYAAKHPDWVQGGGGNCSVKSGRCMAIKASGYFLEDISAEHGYVIVNLDTKKKVGGPDDNISIEADLHHLLGPCTIHTHPVAAAVLACSREGHDHFKALFNSPNYQWIPYATPGMKLAKTVSERLRSAESKRGATQVLLLANHGLFVSAADADSCMALYQTTLDKMQASIDLKEAPPQRPPKGRYLSPDHAVYVHMGRQDLSVKQKLIVDEIDVFSSRVYGTLMALGWQPVWISEDDVADVLGMEQEKYRQKLWEKKG